MTGGIGLGAAVATGAGLGAALVLLVTALRGTAAPDPTRPPSRWAALVAHARTGPGRTRVLAGAGGGALTLVLTHWPVAALAAGALVLAWPHLVGGAAAEQQAIDRLDALVIWTASLRDSVAAHASLEQAIPVSAPHAPALIRAPLLRLAGQIRAQAPLDAALLGLAADLDDPSADLVVAALVLNVRRRGDRLADVLTGLETTAREELDLRRKVAAGRTGLRRGVAIIVAVSVLLAGYLVLFGGTFMDPYDTPTGQSALGLVALMFAAGFFWLRRLAVTPQAAPFLARPGQLLDPLEQRIVAALTVPVPPGAAAASAPQRARTRQGR